MTSRRRFIAATGTGVAALASGCLDGGDPSSPGDDPAGTGGDPAGSGSDGPESGDATGSGDSEDGGSPDGNSPDGSDAAWRTRLGDKLRIEGGHLGGSGGTAVTASDAEYSNEQSLLYGLDAASGDVEWEIEQGYVDDFAVTDSAVTSVSGRALVGRDLDDGSENWSQRAVNDRWVAWKSPRLYVAGADGLRAVDPATGDREWAYDDYRSSSFEQIRVSTPGFEIGDSGTGYHGRIEEKMTQDGKLIPRIKLHAVDLESGERRWRRRIDPSEGEEFAIESMAEVGEHLFVSYDYNYEGDDGRRYGRHVVERFDRANGETTERWAGEGPGSQLTPITGAEGHLVGSRREGLEVLDPQTLEVRWRTWDSSIGVDITGESWTVAGDTVYVAGGVGSNPDDVTEIALFVIDVADGTVRREVTLESREWIQERYEVTFSMLEVTTPPAVLEDWILAYTNTDHVYGIPR